MRCVDGEVLVVLLLVEEQSGGRWGRRGGGGQLRIVVEEVERVEQVERRSASRLWERERKLGNPRHCLPLMMMDHVPPKTLAR